SSRDGTAPAEKSDKAADRSAPVTDTYVHNGHVQGAISCSDCRARKTTGVADLPHALSDGYANKIGRSLLPKLVLIIEKRPAGLSLQNLHEEKRLWPCPFKSTARPPATILGISRQ